MTGTVPKGGRVFGHRRIRVARVLSIDRATLSAAERRAEEASWSTASTNGFPWSCVAAGARWFAETPRGPSSRAGGKGGAVGLSADGTPRAGDGARASGHRTSG